MLKTNIVARVEEGGEQGKELTGTNFQLKNKSEGYNVQQREQSQ